MLYLNNDHSLYVTNLRDGDTYAFLNAASVTAKVLAAKGDAAAITGGDVSLTYVDPSDTGDSIGGVAATDPTTIQSTSKMDLEVTVGANDDLDLTAGRFIAPLHSDTIWRVRKNVVILAGATGWIHLEPFRWPASEPTKVKMTVGEELEIIDGSYKGTLDKAVALVDGTTYYIEYTVVNGGTQDGSWVEEAMAGYRPA